MQIYSKCQKCNEEVKSSTNQITRGDHAMRNREFIELQCVTCNTQSKLHIDDFKTRPSKNLRKTALLILVGGLLVSTLIFLWLWIVKGVILVATLMFSVPVLGYALLIRYDDKRVSTFNRIFVKR
jgi:hypothetical protein